jgi:hypothetical protein
MPRSTTTLIALLACSLLAGCASGNKFENLAELTPNATPAERATRMTELMTTALDLTDDQVPRVQTINLSYANGVDWVAKNKYERSRQKSYFMRDIRAQRDASLRSTLTRDQYTLYKEVRGQLTKQLIEDLSADDG